MQMPTNIMKATFLASWKGEKEENKHELHNSKYDSGHACLNSSINNYWFYTIVATINTHYNSSVIPPCLENVAENKLDISQNENTTNVTTMYEPVTLENEFWTSYM